MPTRTGVIITGGASGIGLATAKALVAEGRPVAIWDLGADRVDAARQSLRDVAPDVPVAAIAFDVTDEAALGPAVDTSRRTLGTIGGLVHAAGNIYAEPIDEVTWSRWSSQIDVHLNAYARIVQALVSDLRANSGSAIVAISSINGLLGNESNPAYSAAKAGMIGLNRSLTARLGRDGIRVNAICPGYIETPMTANSLSRAAGTRPVHRDLLARTARSSGGDRLGSAVPAERRSVLSHRAGHRRRRRSHLNRVVGAAPSRDAFLGRETRHMDSFCVTERGGSHIHHNLLTGR